MNRPVEKRAIACLALLRNLEALLIGNHERNWLRGIQAAIAELEEHDGSVSIDGFENARSIYLGMTAGGRGFSEYHIWLMDGASRVSANSILDQIRTELWIIFKSED